MKATLKTLAALIVVMLSCCALAACGSDDNDDEPQVDLKAKLVGRWYCIKYPEETFLFRASGSGYYTEDLTIEVPFKEYKIENNNLYVLWPANENRPTDEWELMYENLEIHEDYWKCYYDYDAEILTFARM